MIPALIIVASVLSALGAWIGWVLYKSRTKRLAERRRREAVAETATQAPTPPGDPPFRERRYIEYIVDRRPAALRSASMDQAIQNMNDVISGSRWSTIRYTIQHGTEPSTDPRTERPEPAPASDKTLFDHLNDDDKPA